VTRFRSTFLRAVVPPLVPFVMVTVTVELLVRWGLVEQNILPAPSTVFTALFRHARELWGAAAETALGSLAGFAISAVAGAFFGVTLGWSSWIRRAFYPYAVFFQTVPIIAIAPLLVIWVGYGMPTVIASAFIVSLFPVVANTLSGMLSVDPALRDMFKLYEAGPFASLFKLRLPAALPNIITGLRVAAGLAVIGAIVGEFISGGGLGTLIVKAVKRQDNDKVFAALLLASALGLAMIASISAFSRFALRHWHPSESGE
jgi:NitT/TauT family transport system permease protein